MGVRDGRAGRAERAKWCAAGYLVSAAAASLGIIAGFVALQQLDVRSLEDFFRVPAEAASLLTSAMLPIFLATLKLTILPSLVFILVAEAFRLRRWQPYVIFGAALGPAVFWLIAGAPRWEGSALLIIAVGAGALAGFSYWHVAVQRPFSPPSLAAPSIPRE